MEKIDRKPKIKTFLIGKELKRKDLHNTAEWRASGSPQNQNQNPRIAYAEGRVKPLARLLRCATALRVTAPLGCGSGVWYGRKVPFGFAPNMNDNILYHALARPRAPRPDPPLSPRKQRVFRIGPEPSRARSGEADP